MAAEQSFAALLHGLEDQNSRPQHSLPPAKIPRLEDGLCVDSAFALPAASSSVALPAASSAVAPTEASPALPGLQSPHRTPTSVHSTPPVMLSDVMETMFRKQQEMFEHFVNMQQQLMANMASMHQQPPPSSDSPGSGWTTCSVTGRRRRLREIQTTQGHLHGHQNDHGYSYEKPREVHKGD